MAKMEECKILSENLILKEELGRMCCVDILERVLSHLLNSS